ncbi:hypothetical protein MBLNU230_g5022t1 [Neophaeotheca triangularis]
MVESDDSKALSQTNGQTDRLDSDQTSTIKSEQQISDNPTPAPTPSPKKLKCSKPDHNSPTKPKTTRKSRKNAKARVRRAPGAARGDEAEEDSSTSGSESLTGEESSKRSTRRKTANGVRTSKKKCEKKAGKRGTKSESNETSSEESEDESESDDDKSDSEPVRKSEKKHSRKKIGKKAKQDSDDSSEDETPKRSKKKGKQPAKQDSDDSSESEAPERNKKKKSKPAKQDSDNGSDDEASKRKKKTAKKGKKQKKAKKAAQSASDSEDTSSPGDETSESTLAEQIEELKAKLAEKQARKKKRSQVAKSPKADKKEAKKGKTPGYQRVDQVWSNTQFRYELRESTEDDQSAFDDYAFLVRRRFDGENKYRDTTIDIRHVALRTVLQEIMKDCKSVSLEAEEPAIDPNTLFLYLEELRTHYKKVLKARIEVEKKKKVIKQLKLQRALGKTLVEFLDEDYAQIKKTLFPLLAAGNITYELLWALFKPNEVAITSSYGVWDEHRCFKVDMANRYQTMQRDYYAIEGKYFEYDGKVFGMGDFEGEVDAFKGPRKITSLNTFPLRYHKDPGAIKQQIIERGRKFVQLQGMNYRFHKGMAFMKKKKTVLKININGRMMVDPATFRRINPNYSISLIKPHEGDDLISDDDSDDNSDCGCCGSDSDEEQDLSGQQLQQDPFESDKPRTKLKLVEAEDGIVDYLPVEVDENGDPIRTNNVEQLENGGDSSKQSIDDFTDEQLLLATSVVYGFAFSEKLWLEFTVSGVHDITYNDQAFDSLVLPPNQKSIVRALVEGHKFHAAKTIDDVVQGKGKGLVSVLHGPPGTGKTLTAEGISELLRCPLYMVSAGELGTDPAKLEYELQKILDIAHSWGAVLLLDEADVFLEKREVHDIHRNALVSIFLRLLEYFQGILFLTTNRVETFDDAFQSRIHVALRYGELTVKARKTVWKQFLAMVGKQGACEVGEIGERDLEGLGRHALNGRQIKNAVRTAQALALNEKSQLTIQHITRVLDVQQSFDRDLKGGVGYVEAMRSYT